MTLRVESGDSTGVPPKGESRGGCFKEQKQQQRFVFWSRSKSCHAKADLMYDLMLVKYTHEGDEK